VSGAAQLDLYQLTSLVTHHAAGRAGDRVVMAFFSRSLPKHVCTGAPARGWLTFAGLARCLDHLSSASFTAADLAALRAHPMLGPALAKHPALVDQLADWRFRGEVWAPREGTPLFAGPATRLDGERLSVDGVAPSAYCPYLVIETDLLSAKLIETPLLSVINHMTMVATKASHLVAAIRAAGPERPVLEFGQRRTHPVAAIDASVAAYIGGCAATSNVAAHVAHGVPVAGTMDHFAVQAWEQPGVSRHASEFAFFRAFHEMYPDDDTLLVDTYDTFGAHTGIRNAVAATGGRGPRAIRIDSNVSADTVQRARALLDELGAAHTRITVSGGLDEDSARSLAAAPVDAYGVGERIVTSPDSPVGVGAVAKLALVGGRPTMKLSRGSGKATLPGWLQVWRTPERDVVGLRGEPDVGAPLLAPVWTWDGGRQPVATLAEARQHARDALDALPPERRAIGARPVFVSDALVAEVGRLVVGAG
jgi:nicotinate phosphoribosyltransferase